MSQDFSILGPFQSKFLATPVAAEYEGFTTRYKYYYCKYYSMMLG